MLQDLYNKKRNATLAKYSIRKNILKAKLKSTIDKRLFFQNSIYLSKFDPGNVSKFCNYFVNE